MWKAKILVLAIMTSPIFSNEKSVIQLHVNKYGKNLNVGICYAGFDSLRLKSVLPGMVSRSNDGYVYATPMGRKGVIYTIFDGMCLGWNFDLFVKNGFKFRFTDDYYVYINGDSLKVIDKNSDYFVGGKGFIFQYD